MLALSLAGVHVLGQQPAVAPQRQPLLDAKGYVREDAYIRHALPEAERAYAAINGAEMKAIVNEIVAISRKSRDDGNKYWGRIAGTKYEAMTADLLEAKFRKLGMVDINRPEFALPPQWFPTSWDVTASGGGQTMTFGSLLPALGSAPTPASGLDVDAVWVGLGTAADFAGRDVEGKAVVIHTMLSPGQMGQSALFESAFKRAKEAGAAAISRSGATTTTWPPGKGLGGGFSSHGFAPGFFLGFEDGKQASQSDRRRSGEAEAEPPDRARDLASSRSASTARCPARPTRAFSSWPTWTAGSTPRSTTPPACRRC